MVFTPQQATGKKLGSYELLKEVCASSVGATFVGRSSAAEPGGPLVMLTKVHRHVAKSPALCDNFLAAAKKVSVLTDDSVERVVDSGTADGEIYVAYTHHDGDTLASLLRRTGPEGLPLPVAQRVVLDLLEAVRAAYAKSSEFGHGELGPWCAHVGEDGRSRMTGFLVDRALTRFGLHYAKNLDRLPYAAPERVKAMSLTLGPAPPVPDQRADNFSIAVLAWELFTRQRLFASRMEAAVIQKVLASAIPDPKSQRAELSEVVARALVGMLARDPETRLSSEELTRALETSEVASHEAVADFASKQVDKAQARGPNSLAPRAFNSVRPPPMAPAVTAPVSRPKPANGAAVVPLASATPPAAIAEPDSGAPAATEGAALPTPADAPSKSVPPPPARLPSPRGRAKTLMGFAAATVPGPQVAAAPLPAAPLAAEPLPGPTPAAIPAAPPSPKMEAPPPPAWLVEDTGVTDVMQTAVSSPVAPTQVSDEPTALDDDLLVEAEPEEPEPQAPRPPARRPPPKPRQQTLMGIEPLASPIGGSAASGFASSAADEAKTEPLPPVAARAAKAPVSKPEPKPDAKRSAEPARPETTPAKSPPAAVRFTGSIDRLATGCVLGKPPESYQLLAVVARGGMATVWSARREGVATLDDLVAIKTMLPELSDDPDFETMFVDEMRVAARIRHPNVARILSVGEEDNVMYIVMEWVDGETFGGIQQASRSSGGVPLAILIRMASDICAGLHAAHELTDESGHLVDLVHRDINPSNVIVGRNGVSKVVDFGIAKSKGRLHVTRAGSTIKGKAPYLSPEQLGGLTIDRRSDLFSLGALLYVMATGVHPFRGESELQTIENIVLKAPTPLRSVVPHIHADFERLVLRLLEKEAKKRPANADDVRRELERIGELLEKPASAEDVGGFVERMVSDVLTTRRAEMLAVSNSLAGVAGAVNGTGGQLTAADLSPANAAASPGAPPAELLSAASAWSPAPSAEPGTLLGLGGPSAGEPAAIEPTAPLGAFEPGPFAAADDVTLKQPQVAALGVSAHVPSQSEPISASRAAMGQIDEDEPRRSISPWMRLIFLIVIGIAVGIGVIALIEAIRSPRTEGTSTATATAAPTTPAKATGTPVSPSGTMTIDVSPSKTAEPTATDTAGDASSEPTPTSSTTDPSPSKPTGRVGPHSAGSAPRPTGAAPRPVGSSPRPTGSGKKPPPTYNPKGI